MTSILRPVLSLVLFSNVALVMGAVFDAEEYKERLRRTQQRMRQDGMGAMLLTMEVHHNYLTGMSSEFWASPTRPYYLVVPAEGQITAVVPSIIADRYRECDWTVGKLVTWVSPRAEDEGISLLAEELKTALASQPGTPAVIGAEIGAEHAMRMPSNDYLRLSASLASYGSFKDASPLLHQVRAIKSEAEIDIHRTLCRYQSDALEKLTSIMSAGMTEKDVCRLARIEVMKAGADRVPYMSCRSGAGGYDDIIGAATNKKLKLGDVLIIDVGSQLDGYICDFNRNWYVGHEVPHDLMVVQEAVYAAIEAGIKAAKPGHNTADLYHAMASLLPGQASNVGRSGHGLGLIITEWPSILPTEAGQNVTLGERMVFSIEPSLGYGKEGQFLVHEESIAVRSGGGELLSKRASRKMSLITLGLDDETEL